MIFASATATYTRGCVTTRPGQTRSNKGGSGAAELARSPHRLLTTTCRCTLPLQLVRVWL